MRDTIFKTINNIGITKVLRWSKRNSITVISLHRVSEERDVFFNPLLPHRFKKLLEYYCRHYEIVNFSELSKKTTKPKLILSFDDGYYDFIEYAVPILKQFGLPSNHNLVNACLSNNAVIWTQQLNDIFSYLKNNNITNDEITNRAGSTYKGNWMLYSVHFFKKLLVMQPAERNNILGALVAKYNIQSTHRMMNWEDAKNCVEKFDVEIGCHTYHHESLFAITGQSALNTEIGNSIAGLEERLGIKVNILALPNGQYNNTVLEYARSHGLKYVLLHNDHVTAVKELNDHFNLISRIRLVDESVDEAILRSELFHTKIRKPS